jgi:hypothetical protein
MLPFKKKSLHNTGMLLTGSILHSFLFCALLIIKLKKVDYKHFCSFLNVTLKRIMHCSIPSWLIFLEETVSTFSIRSPNLERCPELRLPSQEEEMLEEGWWYMKYQPTSKKSKERIRMA